MTAVIAAMVAVEAAGGVHPSVLTRSVLACARTLMYSGASGGLLLCVIAIIGALLAAPEAVEMTACAFGAVPQTTVKFAAYRTPPQCKLSSQIILTLNQFWTPGLCSAAAL